MGGTPTAERFLERLRAQASPADAEQLARYFRTGPGGYGEGDRFLGVRMGPVNALAREFAAMDLAEIETLLGSPFHEARAGALSVMALQAGRRRTTEERRRELVDLYLRHPEAINSWDLVDLSCRAVVGGYLLDRPRDLLYELARSGDVWRRRAAIVSTWTFIRRGDLDDTFALAALLLGDEHDLIHKATGWMLREAGRQDRARLLAFLDRHAASMPRTALRYAIEHLAEDERRHYLGLGRPRARGTGPAARRG